ncbi:MAG TPA: hypothetical protein VFZ66_27465 [Herpetosiphonaceae bacterium]
MFETPDDREHAAVLIARHQGRIELKAWPQGAVQEDDAPIDAVVIADLSPLFVPGVTDDQ